VEGECIHVGVFETFSRWLSGKGWANLFSFRYLSETVVRNPGSPLFDVFVTVILCCGESAMLFRFVRTFSIS